MQLLFIVIKNKGNKTDRKKICSIFFVFIEQIMIVFEIVSTFFKLYDLTKLGKSVTKRRRISLMK